MTAETLTREQIAGVLDRLIGDVRVADEAVIAALGATPDVLAEYIHDHWLGSPDEPTLETVREHVDAALAEVAR